MLRFNNGLTSAGAALTDPAAAALGAAEGAPAWDRLLATLPSVRGSVPTRARDAAVRPRAAAGVPQRAGRGIDVGAAAVGRRRDRSAALDRLSADPARRPAPARSAGAHVRRARNARRRSREYERTTLAELDATEQLVARALRDDDRSAAVQAAEPALLRGRQLQRDGAPPRPPDLAPGFLLRAHPTFGAGAGGVRGAGGLGFARRRRATALDCPDRPRDRAVRHRRSPRSRSARLVSGPRRGSRRRRRRSWTPRRRRSTACSSAAVWPPATVPGSEMKVNSDRRMHV